MFWKQILRTFLLLLACLPGSLFTSLFCSAADTDQNNGHLKIDNKVTICTHDPISLLDPAVHRSRNIQIILKNMMDALTARDAGLNVVPQLAESWRPLNDTSWEFKLKKGIKFHNGDAFTAEDVKFSLERVFKPDGLAGTTSPRKKLLGSVSNVKIIDSHTVVIETERPWPILPLMLSLHEIVPKTYMEQVGSKGFQNHPMGTGPFQFIKRDGNQRIEMKRFDHYYGGSADIPPVQKARINTLVFQYVPIKADQIRMLKRGEASIISHVDPVALPILKANPDIEVMSCSATKSYYATINCQKPPFNDRRIRQALNYAVDMEAIIRTFLNGQATPLPTVLLPAAIGFNTALTPYGYDPKRAAALLKAADFPMDRELQIFTRKETLPFASCITLFLTRIGLTSKMTQIDYRRPHHKGKEGRWDMIISSWGNSTLDPVGIIQPVFQENGRGNHSGYVNPAVDELLCAAESTSNMALRNAHYSKIQEIVYADAPMIFGYAPMELFAVQKRIRNFAPSLTGMMNMHDVYLQE